MGRLKKDHSGWHTSGLYLKYKQPAVNDRPVKKSAKKDTNHWCRGKVGVEHNFHQKIHFRWAARTFYTTKCVECGKQVPKKRVKSYPLHVEIKQGASNRGFPIQVKINGKALPIDSELYRDDSYYCDQCEQWHY